ncbi:hypothetical protein HNR05_000044 [Leifsonia psychrotolerans]|uniref:Uncharacterized protein n=1 Tax=Glaciibacter psychrotolerans TaxID=670054 RepID=A0A7Z0EB13_9MICO|nr:hypothetical protein [Leifsonia psychrotolerans]NYJ18253.1 hypothetical protein [Leifsonia psychrotolerans]
MIEPTSLIEPTPLIELVEIPRAALETGERGLDKLDPRSAVDVAPFR